MFITADQISLVSPPVQILQQATTYIYTHTVYSIYRINLTLLYVIFAQTHPKKNQEISLSSIFTT
jgi:hypothetical protein